MRKKPYEGKPHVRFDEGGQLQPSSTLLGKTTTAINLSAFLASLGQKVLLVDTDAQGNATSGLGVDREDLDKSVYDLFTGGEEAGAIIRPTEVPGLDILPSTLELAGAEIELVGVENRERLLQRKLAQTRDDYDFVFIDCPPSLGLLTVNALTAADTVLVPIQCEYYALEGVRQLMKTIQLVRARLNSRLQLEGVLLTMFDGRTNLAIQVVQEVKKHFKDKVYRTIVPRNVRLSEAPSYGKPIGLYDRRSRGAEVYHDLAREVLGDE